MSIINCPECSTRISDQADKCPQCAYPLKSKVNNNEGCFLQTLNFGCMFIVVTLGAIILFVFLANMFT
jgi:predicted amidophosphoribosyltransferase